MTVLVSTVVHMTRPGPSTQAEQRSATLPERRSPTAARILTAAEALLLGRGSKGFTVADVAQKAHVGKGTVYLYWATKEDLLLGLIARDFVAVAEDTIDALRADAQMAQPARFCPYLLQSTGQRTLVKALQDNDDGLLGVLTDHPMSLRLRDALGPAALLNAVLPAWRTNGLASTDWPLADQVFALNALIAGFQLALRDPVAPLCPYSVMAAAVTALLGPEPASTAQIDRVAVDIVSFLEHGRTKILDLIGVLVDSDAECPPTALPTKPTADHGEVLNGYDDAE